MKIAIAGYGLEGQTSYRYWNQPGNNVVIVDEKDPVLALPVDASVIIGHQSYEKLAGYDMVIRTAGLAPRKIRTDGKIWSATNEFFAKCPAPIIGVTGSKGKGTTSSLIDSILRAAGYITHLVGNIGVPALDVLSVIKPDDIVIYELSSFQLWDIERSPQLAVVLMIEPDHLDVHNDLSDYIEAKSRIARFQTSHDTIIYKSLNMFSTAIAVSSQATQIPFPSEDNAHVRDNCFYYGEQKLCSVEVLQLPGEHNQENACAAIDAVWKYVSDGHRIAQGLAAFTGLPHRLKFVRDVNGVSYYDDSIATTPGSAIAAMRALGQPKIMILGGSSKGAQFDDLASVAAESNVKMVFIIGDEADVIESALQQKKIHTTNLGHASNMTDIVRKAHAAATAGDAVVLSPACASFGMFKNYSDRGDQFIAAVERL